MPELPEVEVVRLGLTPHVVGQRILNAVVRDHRLRWPVPEQLPVYLKNQRVLSLARRGKYLLMEFEAGHLILHLGMSGVLTWTDGNVALRKHDHLDLEFERGLLRLNDPRRFGAALWYDRQAGSILEHPLLMSLGLEPLNEAFSGRHLFDSSRGKTLAVKQFLLAGHAVVGVGNIYASETLFRAGIHPTRAAGRVGAARYDQLALAVRQILSQAIILGGSTLRDFRDAQGHGGAAQNSHSVYNRQGLPCERCAKPIMQIKQQQRSTYFCRHCQR
jgi:formamidopyrimidine-DNA glycosylase